MKQSGLVECFVGGIILLSVQRIFWAGMLTVVQSPDVLVFTEIIPDVLRERNKTKFSLSYNTMHFVKISDYMSTY